MKIILMTFPGGVEQESVISPCALPHWSAISGPICYLVNTHGKKMFVKGTSWAGYSQSVRIFCNMNSVDTDYKIIEYEIMVLLLEILLPVTLRVLSSWKLLPSLYRQPVSGMSARPFFFDLMLVIALPSTSVLMTHREPVKTPGQCRHCLGVMWGPW